MADQATVTVNGPSATRSSAVDTAPSSAGTGHVPHPGDVVGNVSEFGENLLTLGELQARLALVELKENLEASKTGAALILGSLVLALAGVPIALAGVAELLVSELGMRRGYALLSVAAVAMAIAGACIAIAVSLIRRGAIGFPITREEFTRNLNWLRTVLLHSGRSTRRR